MCVRTTRSVVLGCRIAATTIKKRASSSDLAFDTKPRHFATACIPSAPDACHQASVPSVVLHSADFIIRCLFAAGISLEVLERSTVSVVVVLGVTIGLGVWGPSSTIVGPEKAQYANCSKLGMSEDWLPAVTLEARTSTEPSLRTSLGDSSLSMRDTPTGPAPLRLSCGNSLSVSLTRTTSSSPRRLTSIPPSPPPSPRDRPTTSRKRACRNFSAPRFLLSLRSAELCFLFLVFPMPPWTRVTGRKQPSRPEL
mmetsp:Transcript_33278/g.75844  ORF Transcript_33278/g.75844 Transcript_33278/m.75844 type:complete len:253 (+) Transcript_33278:352-1110(+)